MDFQPYAEHLSVADKSAFADVLGKAAWGYACYYIRDMSAKVGTKTNTSFFSALPPADSTETSLSWLHGWTTRLSQPLTVVDTAQS